MVLSGVWHIDTSASSVKTGFLAAQIMATSSTIQSFVYNITTEFEAGTTYACGGPSRGNGVLISGTEYCTAQGIALGGIISSCTSSENLGGIFCYFLRGTLFMLRNIATFENDLVGNTVAGVAVHAKYSMSTYLMNAMIGNLVGFQASGGVVANLEAASPDFVDVVVNAMTGNVTGSTTVSSTTYEPSSICYQTISTGTFTRFMSYMKGDTGDGLCSRPRTTITNSIVAITGTIDEVTSGSEVSKDDSFGMTVNDTGYTNVSTSLTGYTYNTEFGDLPYVPFVGTDMGGTTHNWEFVFPNAPGKAAYSACDITISTAPTISAPIGVQFDLPENNTTEYVSYFKQPTSEVYVEDSLTVVNSSASFVYDYTGVNQKFPPTLGMDLYCVLAYFSWLPVVGASWYVLRYEKDGVSEVEFVSMTTELQATLFGVDPGASYEVFLYSNLDLSTPVLSSPGVAPTVDAASVQSLLQRLGNDITVLPLASLSLLDGKLDEALSTGDRLRIKQGDALFVENAGTIALTQPSETFLTSFSGDSGSGQNVTVTLPDSSSTVISYNETDGTLSVDSTEFEVGSYFVIGNFKVSVQDLT